MLERLMKKALERHEAIHAVGSVLGEQIYNTMTGSPSSVDINEQYVRKLEALISKGWPEFRLTGASSGTDRKALYVR